MPSCPAFAVRGKVARGGAKVAYRGWPGRVVMAGQQLGRGGLLRRDGGGRDSSCSPTPK